MKAEAWVFWAVAIYLGVMSGVYSFVSYKTQGQVEIIGSVVLVLAFLFAAMIAGYLSIHGHRMDPRPEDRPDATIAEGAGDYGFFATSSIWPFWAGLVVMMMFLGWIFGHWLMIIAFAIGIWAVAGWSLQYYRGDYAH